MAFVNYLAKPDDSLRTGSSFVSALLAIFLICVLISKSWDFCSFSKPCKNAIKIFIYTFIHLFLIFSIFLYYGITYLPIIALFVGLLSGLIIPSELREQLRKRVSIRITIICVIILVLVYLSTIFVWNIFPKTDENSLNYLIIASSMLFFSMGGIITSTIVVAIFSPPSENRSNQNFFDWLNREEVRLKCQVLLGVLILVSMILLLMIFG